MTSILRPREHPLEGMASQQGQPGVLSMQVQTGEAVETTDDQLKLDEPLRAFFNMKFPYFNIVLLLGLVLRIGYFEVSFVSMCSIIFLVSFFLTFIVHVVVVSGSECIPRKDDQLLCKLVYVSTLLQIFGAATLLLFLDTIHKVIVLPLLLTVLALVALFWQQTFRNNVLGKNWGKYKAELKLRFDLSAQVVSMALAGLFGTVINYVKVSSNLISRTGYMAPHCFLFYSFVLALLVVLLSTVPSRIDHMQTRGRMAKVYLRIVAYAALLCLVLAYFMAAQFFSCFILVLVVVASFFWERRISGDVWIPQTGTQAKKNELNSASDSMREPNNPEPSTQVKNNEEDDFMQRQLFVHGFYFPSILSALMAVQQSTYGIEGSSWVPFSWWFKVIIVLSALCSILFYVVRMVLYVEMPDMKSSTGPKKFWSNMMHASMASTTTLAIVFGLLYTVEAKKFLQFS